MPFDYKKEYPEFYLPKNEPGILTVPPMSYIAVRGQGNPNSAEGAYQKAIGILYTLAFTIRMSSKGAHKMDGFFEFVVPPLEGFWWQENVNGVDYSNKTGFHWISVIRVPDFVTPAELEWAKQEAAERKKADVRAAEFLRIEEGLCVQMMHIGRFDDEPQSVARMDRYLEEQGFENDFSNMRLHHEIYLSDARKVPPERWRTVIRHPIREKKNL